MPGASRWSSAARSRWHRIIHGDSELDWLSIAAAQRILGEAGIDIADLVDVTRQQPASGDSSTHGGRLSLYRSAMPTLEERIAARLHQALDRHEGAQIEAPTAVPRMGSDHASKEIVPSRRAYHDLRGVIVYLGTMALTFDAVTTATGGPGPEEPR